LILFDSVSDIISTFAAKFKIKMNRFRFSLLAAVAIATAACNNAEPEAIVPAEPEVIRSFYGDSITVENAITIAELNQQMLGKDSLLTKVSATISQTCAKMGCWMDVDMGNGEVMTVFMRNHSFFVPTQGCEGKVAIFEGKAYLDTLSVENLIHFAEDAGKSAEEIALITEPKPTISFDAKGVIIDGIPEPTVEAVSGESHESHEGHDHAEGEVSEEGSN